MSRRFNRPYILVRPPQRASGGAQVIRNALGDEVCRLSRIDVIPHQYRWVINWGNAGYFNDRGAGVINNPHTVRLAVNKLESLTRMKDDGISVPEFSTSLDADGRTSLYLARAVLNGSGGAGIVVLRPQDAVVAAELYTKYIKKKLEYRVHVAFGEVIFSQQKKRENDHDRTPDERLIRSYDNGWVYCPREVPDEVASAGVAAVSSLELDFGAVDIVVGRDDGVAYVLEVNTAPGITSPLLIQAYKEAFLSNLQR